jgi:DNA-binding response OmpR family regulator
MRELVARVRSLSKRKSSQSQRLKVGPLKMDLSLRVATRDETPLRLTPTSWKLLELLMRAAPGVVSRDQMVREIWQGEDIPNSEVLKVHLHKLRKQVDKPFSSNLIQTITSHGVRLRVNDD